MKKKIICELCENKQQRGETHCSKCGGIFAFNTKNFETETSTSAKAASYNLKNIIFYVMFFVSVIVLLTYLNKFGDLSDAGPFLYIFTPFLLLFFLKKSSKKTSINRYLVFSLVFFPLILASYILPSYSPSGSADGLPFFSVITAEYIILTPFIIGRVTGKIYVLLFKNKASQIQQKNNNT